MILNQTKLGKNIKFLPYAFTEHGVLQAANVMRSPIAHQVSINIIRIFNQMRQVLASHEELKQLVFENHEEIHKIRFEIQKLSLENNDEHDERENRRKIGFDLPPK